MPYSGHILEPFTNKCDTLHDKTQLAFKSQYQTYYKPIMLPNNVSVNQDMDSSFCVLDKIGTADILIELTSKI